MEQIVTVLKEGGTSKPGGRANREGWRFGADVLPLEEDRGGLEPDQSRRLKQLEEESAKFKCLVADQWFDMAMQQEVLDRNP